MVDLSDCHLFQCHLRNTVKRVEDISGQISEILDQGFHKAGVLAALRGRLQFAETQIAGRQACRVMVVVHKEITAKPRGGSVTPELDRALKFLRDRILAAYRELENFVHLHHFR